MTPRPAFVRRPDAPKSNPHYHTPAHKRWRKAVLARHPICIFCEDRGLVVVATDADHITPIREGGRLLDIMNGQGLCRSCHARKSAKEGKDKNIL